MTNEKRNNAITRRQEKQREELLEQLKKTPVVQVACKRVGIGRTTYYRWAQQDKDFAEAATEALRDGSSIVSDMAESQLIAAIRDRNLTAIIYWLKHHHPTYATRIELTTKQAPINELSPEQEQVVSQALKLAGLTSDETDNQQTS